MPNFNKEFSQKSYSLFSDFCFALYEHFGEQTDVSIPVPYEPAPPDDCGLGCVAMLLKFKNVSIPTIQQLSRQYKNKEYYIDNVGWKHDGLVAILEQFGIAAYRVGHQGIFQISHSLKKEKPLIASLRVPRVDNLAKDGVYVSEDKSQPLIGHLCVIVGIENGNILFHDPRNIQIYKDKLRVPFTDFRKVFTGRCIYLK